MSAAVIAPEPEPTTQPRRRGRPRSAAADAVRKYADAILASDVSVAMIAEQYGVARFTVYRWLKAGDN